MKYENIYPVKKQRYTSCANEAIFSERPSGLQAIRQRPILVKNVKKTVLSHYPPFQITGLAGYVRTYLNHLSAINGKGKGIILGIYLRQCFLCRASFPMACSMGLSYSSTSTTTFLPDIRNGADRRIRHDRHGLRPDRRIHGRRNRQGLRIRRVRPCCQTG